MSEWWRWQHSADYSIGIEEEVMLLDPAADWGLSPRAGEVIAGADDDLADRLDDETQEAVVELATDPHPGPGSATGQLAQLRRGLSARLEQLGLRAAGAGTHPCHVWTDTQIAQGERHHQVYESMRELARREPTFGMHVHVGVSDAERGMTLYNRMRVHLPLLLALSANSPFWQGRDTGLASARTPIFQAFPRVGMPRAFESYERWVAVVDRLLRCGALSEPTFLWWDIRPQPKFGTIEIRVMDAQSDNDATVALAALVQSLAHFELEEAPQRDAVVEEIEILTENRFIASRDGMDAELLDPVNGTRIEARTLLGGLLQQLQDHAQQLGCATALGAVPDLAARTGAQQQRDALERCGSLAEVLPFLSDHFPRPLKVGC